MKTRRHLLAIAAVIILGAGLAVFFPDSPTREQAASEAPVRDEAKALTIADAQKREIAPAPAAKVQAAVEQRPPPDAVAVQDGYPIMGQQRTFFRRAGAVAIRVRDGETIEKLTAAGSAFAGYTAVRTWPGGVTVLRAPEAEVARQIAEPARAAAWLAEVRAGGAAAMANPVLIDPPSGLMMIPFGEIIVRLNPGVEAARYFGADFARARRLDGTTDQFVVALKTTDFETTVAEIARHAARAEVVWAEPNFICEGRPAFVPNDPLYGEQWHLGGDSTGTLGYNRADVGAETAWDTTRGEPDIVVGVIDDGFDIDQEDLAPNLFVNTGEIPGNGIDDDNNGYVDDVNGWDFWQNDNDPRPIPTNHHGTAVAGVAVARGNNGIGVSGAAPRCRLLPVTWPSTTAGFADSVRYAAGLSGSGWRGADVINMSIEWPQAATHDSALADAARQGRQGRGCVLLGAAGNGASAYQLVGWPLTAGTHNLEWRFSKIVSVSEPGDDGVFVDGIGFYDDSGVLTVPQYGSAEFSGGAPGFTSGGAQPWTFHNGSDRAVGIVDSLSVRSGRIGAGESTSLFYTKIMPGDGQVRFYLWVDFSVFNKFEFFIDGIVAPGGTFSGRATTTVAPGYPGSHPDVICVGASTDFDLRSGYSQYGAALDIVAPSSGGYFKIRTTDRTGADGYDPGAYNGTFGGTSSATPLASGVAALALSVNPWMTQRQVRALLLGTANKIGGVSYDGTGFNPYYGYGRVNAAAAVAAARGPQLSSYTQNFNAFADNTGEFNDGSSFCGTNQRQPPIGTALYSTASVQGGALRLHEKVSYTVLTTYALPNLGNAVTNGFEATFRYKADATGVPPGDGFSFNYGRLREGLNAGPQGFGKGLSVSFQTTADATGYFAREDGITLPQGTSDLALSADNAWHSVRIRWRKTAGTGINGPAKGTLTVSVDDVAVLRDVETSFTPEAPDSFVFAAFNGANSEDLFLDDVSVQPIGPERYSRGYDGYPLNQTALSDGSITTASVAGSVGVDVAAGRVGYRLAKNSTLFNLTSYALPTLSTDCTQGFEATFLYYMASTFATPADGFAFSFGNLASTNSGPGGLADGLAVSFDIYSANNHRVLVDGAIVPGGTNPAHPFVDGQWHAVKIRWEKTAGSSGVLTLTVDGVALFDRLATPGFTATATDRFVFTAFTGAYAADVLVDDVMVRPLFTSPFPLAPLTIWRNPNANPDLGILPLRWGSVPGHNHRVEFSDDLANWQTATTRPGIDGFDFLTPIVSFSSTPKRFYRVIRE